MLHHQRLLERLFTSFITVLTSIVAAETAMSNPVFIDPSKEYQEPDYILNGRGNAYDFCFDNKVFGYIVLSEAASQRLERRYPIRSNCIIPTASTTGSNSFSQVSSSNFSLSYDSSTDFYSNNAFSNKKQGCQGSQNTRDGRFKKCPKKRS